MKLYEEASNIAEEHLNPAHTVTLIIACEFSQFLLNSVDKGLAILKEAYKKGQSCSSEDLV